MIGRRVIFFGHIFFFLRSMVGHFGTHLGTHFGHERESMKRGHSGILVWAGGTGRISQVGNASVGMNGRF